MSLSLGVRSSEDILLEEKFKTLTQKISMLLACEGVHRKPYLDGLPHFSKLTVEKKKIAVDHVQFYHDLCVEQVSDGYKIKDSLSFTWRALSKLGLAPKADLFQHLTEEHIFEIYSDENVQLFRNFNFFEFCSYTLEELHSLEWWSLFEREPHVTRQLFDYASRIFSGELTGNFKPNVENHVLRELQSTDRLVMEHRVDWMGPLLKARRPRALLIMSNARLLNN
ncbi:hypothetical protein QJS83_07695 [Bdellovibrio sp. 22V]|uniref:hypothetical protein n=1 Tax=Bdellovibrio TaxID=958 RepID=UPI002543CF21|nr:hypothetical protein [Bdellovibrio sp. 22V]WII73758.1 hypothetical protein QJS83_07695 [Bdellovibrio sp. 22V]